MKKKSDQNQVLLFKQTIKITDIPAPLQPFEDDLLQTISSDLLLWSLSSPQGKNGFAPKGKLGICEVCGFYRVLPQKYRNTCVSCNKKIYKRTQEERKFNNGYQNKDATPECCHS